MKDVPPNHQLPMAVRVVSGVAAVTAALALADRIRGGVTSWGPVFSLSGLLVLMTTNALDVPRGALRSCLRIAGVLSVACGSLIYFSR